MRFLLPLLVVALLTGCGSGAGQKYQLHGSIMNLSTRPCAESPRAPVTVRNGAGAVIGTGSTTRDPAASKPSSHGFLVSVPKADFYQVTVGGFTDAPKSFADIRVKGTDDSMVALVVFYQ